MEKNKTYIERLTKKDIRYILAMGGFQLDENTTDLHGEPLKSIERNKNIALCRVKPLKVEKDKLEDAVFQQMYGKLVLYAPIFNNDFCNSLFHRENQLVFIENYCAYVPFDDDLTYSQKITSALHDVCTRKFGSQYLKDKKAYIKELENEENKVKSLSEEI